MLRFLSRFLFGTTFVASVLISTSPAFAAVEKPAADKQGAKKSTPKKNVTRSTKTSRKKDSPSRKVDEPEAVPFEADEPNQPLVLPHSHEEVTERHEGEGFEGHANELILNSVATAIGEEAAKEGWRISPRVRTFPVDFDSPGEGSRAAEFALRSGGNQRAVIMTSTFHGRNSDDVIVKDGFDQSLEKARAEIQLFASNFMVRLRTAPLRPREMPVDKVECTSVLDERFCIHARLMDSISRDPATITAALRGPYDGNDTINLIRDQNLAWPVDKTFVLRGYKECKCRDNHMGLDLRAPVGTNIRSVADGVVRNVGRFSGWGKTVVIQHTMVNGEKFVSLYAHLSTVKKNLRVGDAIGRGEVIAQTGMTGRTTAPHLHLEIRPEREGREVLKRTPARVDRPIDPLKVLNMMKAFIGDTLLGKPANAKTR